MVLAGCGGEEKESTPVGTAAATPAPTGTATGGKPYGAEARAATLSPESSPGITDTEILLGAEVILSGTNGAVYSTLPGATKAYFEYINDTQGGVCGRKIVYKVEDNFDDPARAVETTRRLVEQDKVFAMVGSLSDAAHPATMEFLNERGVPDLLVSAGGARFGADPSANPWTVQMIPSYEIDGTFLGQYISENLTGKTIAVLWENDTIGQDGFAGLKQELDPNSNPIIAEQSYEYTAISINSQMAILAKSKADILVLHSNLGFVAQAMKSADRLGWHPTFLAPYIVTDDMIFQFAPPELIAGTLARSATKMATWRDDPAVARHYELMNQYDGPQPSNFTIYAQILAELAVEILGRSCDNLTREGLMEAAESLRDWHSDLTLDGVKISFSPTDHVAFQSGRFLEAKVDENGKGYWEYFGPITEFQGIS
jgi:branched-chain amino acid transport system substrate-binding protein